ncbi:MAG: hypothetical protein ACYSU0_08615 [Planctomycetota bacterium]
MMQACRTALLVAAVVALQTSCDTGRRQLTERQARVLAAEHYSDLRSKGAAPRDADGNPVPRPALTADSWQEVTRTADGGWVLSVETADGTRLTARLDRNGRCSVTDTIIPMKLDGTDQ